MRAAVLALLIALPCFAQERIRVQKALVTAPDGSLYDLSGGCWLSEGVCLATGKELERLRAENVELKQSGIHPALPAAAFVVGLAVGAIAVHFIARKP